MPGVPDRFGPTVTDGNDNAGTATQRAVSVSESSFDISEVLSGRKAGRPVWMAPALQGGL